MKTFFVLATAFIAAACGGSAAEPAFPPMPSPSAEKAAAPAPHPGKLARGDVVRVVDAGLGRFLGQVDVEPSVERGAFRGFRIVELRPAEFWQGVDLRPGDVVTRVNDMPIERETQAWEAFMSLKKARHLKVSYLRGGIERELSFEIVDGDTPPPPASAKGQKAGDAG